MSKRPALFTETDVKRAIKATQAAGLPVGAVKIEPDGTIHVVVGNDAKPVDAKREIRL